MTDDVRPAVSRLQQARQDSAARPPRWHLLLGIALSGLLMALSLPPADLCALGWVSLVPLLIAVRGHNLYVGLLSGMAMLLVAGALTHSGIFYPPNQIARASVVWNYLGFYIFGMAVGGISALVATRPAGERSGLPLLLGLAGIGVLLEAALLIYLPAHMGLTQYRNAAMLMLASVTGIWGVSFVVWVANLALADRLGLWLAGSGPRPVGVAAGVAVLVATHGIPLAPVAEGPGALTIGAVQTRSGELKALARFNADAGARGADLVVWPELSAMSIAMNGKTEPLVALAKQEGQPPFVTSFQDGSGRKPHNAAAVFCRQGESARYFKRKPFAGESAMHTAGTEAVAVPLSVGGVAGINICFDSCFPHIMRETARLPGVGLILLPTLDPPGPCGTIQAIHAAYTPFRSAELGLPIVRADITAFSMITDQRGAILVEGGPGGDEVLTARVTPGKRWTLYTVLGDYFLLIAAALGAWGLWVSRERDAEDATAA